MEPGLPPRAEPAHADVGIGVAGQQDGLVEHHRRVPHARRAAEEGKAIRANIGWTRNSRLAPTKIVTPNRISTRPAPGARR